MEIIIVGGGKVGETLISHLSEEGKEIKLIDISENVVDKLVGKYDIIGYEGNGITSSILKEAGIKTADIFISVTASDEINIISAIIAKQMGANYTIARVRNPDYADQFDFMTEKIGIDLIINPDLAAAIHMEQILRFPYALDVEFFAEGRVYLVKSEIHKNMPIVGKAIHELKSLGLNILICIVKRGDKIIIPRGNFVLKENDQIFKTGTLKALEDFRKIMEYKGGKTERLLIIGGGRITHYLIERLIKYKKEIKVIEMNFKIAEELALNYPKAIIINGDGTDQEFLMTQGIKNADGVLALTGIDEENILISMLAASLNIPKSITKINRKSLLKIVENIGLQSIITPNNLMANEISRTVRAKMNIDGNKILKLYKLLDNNVEILEFNIVEDKRVTGISLSDLALNKNAIFMYLIRGKDILFPDGNVILKEGDRAIIATKKTGVTDICELIN